MPLRIGIYARVSTDEQDPAMQVSALRAHAQQRGWTIVHEYVDSGISGTRQRRPALDRLMRAAWSGELQAVLVWRFDRFARSTKHLLAALDTFRSLGVAFISIQEQLDTSTPMGQAMFTIIGALAQLEREIIRERILGGLKHARVHGTKSGKAIGRPRGREVNLEQARSLLAQGLSLRQVARQLGVHPMTISRAVTNGVPTARAKGRRIRRPERARPGVQNHQVGEAR